MAAADASLIPASLRGLFSLMLLAANTIFWVIPIYILALLKLLVPIPAWQRLCYRLLNRCAGSWIAGNNLNLRFIQNIQWDVEGLEQLDPEQWYLVVANHQSWADILVLQKIFHRKIPFLKFFLKKELIWFPLLGLAWWALDFPFMQRYSQAFLEKHPHLKGKDLEATQHACRKFKTVPITVMNFVEGTRFTPSKHERQQSPFRRLLKPKAGGIAFVLAAMGNHFHRLLDVTIVYPHGVKTFWQFLCGQVEAVKVRVEPLAVGEELIGDYFNDDDFRQRFQAWLNSLWQQKDRYLESVLEP